MLLGVVLDPLAEAETVGLRTDGGEGPPRMSETLPQMLQPLLKTVNRENVNDPNEVALLRSVYDVQRIPQVWQQAAVLSREVWDLRRVGTGSDVLRT